MTILDRFYQFSSAQDLSQVVGTYASTDIFDLHGTGLLPTLAADQGARDMGVGDKPSLKLLAQVVEVFASAGAATLQIHFQGAPDDGAGAPGSYVTMASSPIVALANLVAGARLWDTDWPRPAPGQDYPRFVRLLYEIAGATTTTGTVSSWIVLDRQDQPSQDGLTLGGYPAGLTVSN